MNTHEATDSWDYTDSGARCDSYFDGSIDNKVVIAGDVVRTDKPGTYKISYNCKDSTGRKALRKIRTVVILATETSCAQTGDKSGTPSTNPALQPEDTSTNLCTDFTFHKGFAAGSVYIMDDPTLGTAERWGTFDSDIDACKSACAQRNDCKGFDYYGPEIGPGYSKKQCAMFLNNPALSGGGTSYWRTYTKNPLPYSS